MDLQLMCTMVVILILDISLGALGASTATAQFDFYADAGSSMVKSLSIKHDAVIVNENSADVDFRVESDANTHAFFVEGSSGNVGIGASPIATHSAITQLTLGGNSLISFHTATGASGALRIGQNSYLNSSGNILTLLILYCLIIQVTQHLLVLYQVTS